MGLIIADSGSSKTAWAWLDDGQVLRTETTGLNPSYFSKEQMVQYMRQELDSKWLEARVEAIHFYGAGCSGESRPVKMKEALQLVFPHTAIDVQHDLMGAARACLGREEGLIAILGTGSSMGYYDGNRVKSKFPALGHLLGDEGSGVELGRTLLQRYLYRELEQGLIDAFREKHQMTDDQIIVELYKADAPNRYMASFTRFLSEHSEHPQIMGIIEGGFTHFFEQLVCKYNNHQNVSMGFIGSVAKVFEEPLKKTADRYSVKVARILQAPLDALVDFHRK